MFKIDIDLSRYNVVLFTTIGCNDSLSLSTFTQIDIIKMIIHEMS